MNDTVSFEDKYLHNFLWLSNQIYPFKVCNTDCVMTGFDKHFIIINFYLMV